MITVRIPATSANMGSGFDSIGIALQIYNTVSACETEGGLTIEISDASARFLPRDEHNLVYRAMMEVFQLVGHQPRGIHMIQQNNIPVTRGLGSSSAGIVGGLILANELSGRKLSQTDLIALAAKLEGHPDNVTPAFTGGMAIAVRADIVRYLNVPVDEQDLRFALLVPDFILRTRQARSVLPRSVRHEDAVFNTSRAALLTAAMLTRQYDHLSVALQDRLHQPYRKNLIKGSGTIFHQTQVYGALGTYISGAGPTIMSVVRTAHAAQFESKMQAFFKQRMPNWTIQLVQADNEGAKMITND